MEIPLYVVPFMHDLSCLNGPRDNYNEIHVNLSLKSLFTSAFIYVEHLAFLSSFVYLWLPGETHVALSIPISK